MKLKKNYLFHLKTDIKIICNWREVVSLSSIMFNHCVLNCSGSYKHSPD